MFTHLLFNLFSEEIVPTHDLTLSVCLSVETVVKLTKLLHKSLY